MNLILNVPKNDRIREANPSAGNYYKTGLSLISFLSFRGLSFYS